MSSAFTDMLGQGGLWGGLVDFGRDFGSGWRDLAGRDSFLRNWWTGDLGDGKSSNVNLRNFTKFVGGSQLGSAIDDYTGGSWGSSAVSGLRNIGNLDGLSGDSGGGLASVLNANVAPSVSDNSMIAPIKTPDLFAEPQQRPSPELIALLLAQMQHGGDSNQHNGEPYISGLA